MHHLYLLTLIALLLLGCENHNFDGDRRQIIAKDAIRRKLPHAARNFDVVAFREDTVANWNGDSTKRPLRYTLDYMYTDSTGAAQQKTGAVFFTPDGRSMISAEADNPMNP